MAVPPPFFGERPGGLLTIQEAPLSLTEGPEQGQAPPGVISPCISVAVFPLLLLWDQRKWSQHSGRSWTRGHRVLRLLPLPGGEHGTPFGVPAHNPCPVSPLSLSWVESGCQYYCSVTVLGLQGPDVLGRYEPRGTTWASTVYPIYTSWCSVTACVVQSHLEFCSLVPWRMVTAYKTFLGVPSVSPGLLEQNEGKRRSKQQWQCFPRGAPVVL